MKSRSFSLTPFSSGLSGIDITVSIERSSNKLTVSYSLTGDISELVIPAPTDLPERSNAIWEETCFELFIGLKNSDNYWEFNISPAGHWNVYRFSSYREGRQEEPAFTSLPFKVSIHHNALLLSLELDLDKIKLTDEKLNAGISAVIKHRDSRMTYWALTHTKERPDFHNKESFIIEL
ncbi:MAG: DOMON-like domain-containing protein [Thermodesulfovibrionia bacterium]|nr:DOMON-like domain-containing protein [Thermodesulfovibrionia bacterium]